MDRHSATAPVPTPTKILVVGVDSPLGANLAMAWSRHAPVVGLARHGCAPWGVCTYACTPERRDPAGEIIRRERPGWVVYCGPAGSGRWDLDAAEEDLAGQKAICACVARAAQCIGAHLTVFSTDAVFTGSRLFHAETSRVASPGVWARVAGGLERSLIRTALVVRTCAYGWGPPGARATFAERLWLALRDGIPWPADPDSFASPVLATDLADPLWNAMRRRTTGLYHAGGAERISLHRFAVTLAQMASLPHDAQAIPPRGPDAASRESSLDSRLFADIASWTPPMAREGLARFLGQRNNGWRQQLSGRCPTTYRCDAA
jgi:dTDP-4-dehydrorhamnose reductase